MDVAVATLHNNQLLLIQIQLNRKIVHLIVKNCVSCHNASRGLPLPCELPSCFRPHCWNRPKKQDDHNEINKVIPLMVMSKIKRSIMKVMLLRHKLVEISTWFSSWRKFWRLRVFLAAAAPVFQRPHYVLDMSGYFVRYECWVFWQYSHKVYIHLPLCWLTHHREKHKIMFWEAIT